jgi:cold shock CspA family protein
MTSQLQYGEVSAWREEGFGFIRADDGRSIFFHIRNFLDELDPYAGQRVSFNTRIDPRRGKLEAYDVAPK